MLVILPCRNKFVLKFGLKEILTSECIVLIIIIIANNPPIDSPHRSCHDSSIRGQCSSIILLQPIPLYSFHRSHHKYNGDNRMSTNMKNASDNNEGDFHAGSEISLPLPPLLCVNWNTNYVRLTSTSCLPPNKPSWHHPPKSSPIPFISAKQTE